MVTIRKKKGLTASGNVAESHCIPILAPSPPAHYTGGEEPFVLAKLQLYWISQIFPPSFCFNSQPNLQLKQTKSTNIKTNH